VSTPAPQQAVLRQAERLGRRHGKAAVYWPIGDSGSDAALGFYGSLLRGAGGDPQITGLFEMPGLDGRHDCNRDSLAADLGLARDASVLDQAAQAYLAGPGHCLSRSAHGLSSRSKGSRPAPKARKAGTLRADPGSPKTAASLQDNRRRRIPERDKSVRLWINEKRRVEVEFNFITRGMPSGSHPG